MRSGSATLLKFFIIQFVRTFSAFVDGPDSDMELSLRSDPILLHSIESLNNNTLVQFCFHNMYGILDQKFGTFLFACVRIWITFFKVRSRSGSEANCSQSTILVQVVFHKYSLGHFVVNICSSPILTSLKLSQPFTEQKNKISVADPDPWYPYIFGPPGSGSVIRDRDPDPSIIKQK
jgi:hypothetical protein